MQAVLLMVFFAKDAWSFMYSITTVMVLPAYFTTTLYLFKLCVDNEYAKYAKEGKKMAIASGVIGSIFCLFMLYAGGLNYISMMPLILTLGIPLYIWARKEEIDVTKDKIFNEKELSILYILFFLDIAVLGLVYFKDISF